MPAIINVKHIQWDPGTGTEWLVRWKLSSDTAWSYSVPLFLPSAYFAVIVEGDPYPPGPYVGVLDIAKRYDVEVQSVCSSSSKSAWTPPYRFDTFLSCPNISGAPTYTIPDVDEPNTILFDFQYDCMGSPIYPTLELRYKESLSMVYTHVPYPRDGTSLLLTLPAPGTYSLILASQCTELTGTILSPEEIYTF